MAAKDQDFNSFYTQEMGFRKALNYPPFSRMIQLKISGKDKLKTRDEATKSRRLVPDTENSQSIAFRQR